MKRKFSDSMVQQIVKEYLECRSPKCIFKKYGMSKSSLYYWTRVMRQVKRPTAQPVSLWQIHKMERRLKVLQEENQIFKESGCATTDSIEKKMAAIVRLKENYSIHALCRTLHLAKGTYYNRTFRRVPQTIFEQTDNELRPLISKLFEESKGRFGVAKIRIKLLECGKQVSRRHISALMKDMGLVCKQAQLRYFNTTNRKYVFRKNHVMQRFHADLPNVLWVSDVTYIRVNSVFHSLCVVIDVFSRKVISHAISISNDTALVLSAFQKAYENRGRPVGLTFHSDQGLQYAAQAFRMYLREHGVTQSFSNPGTPHDNAVAEAFFSIMKREEISHNYYHSAEELEATVADYIEFYNSMRPHRKLHNLSPDQFERSFFAKGTNEPV